MPKFKYYYYYLDLLIENRLSLANLQIFNAAKLMLAHHLEQASLRTGKLSGRSLR